jgi:hypothetical protein
MSETALETTPKLKPEATTEIRHRLIQSIGQTGKEELITQVGVMMK